MSGEPPKQRREMEEEEEEEMEEEVEKETYEESDEEEEQEHKKPKNHRKQKHSRGGDDDEEVGDQGEDQEEVSAIAEMAAAVEEENDQQEEGLADDYEAAAAGGKEKELDETQRAETLKAQEQATLFKSNMFRLQLVELLAEATPKYARLGWLDTAVKGIKDELDRLLGQAQRPVSAELIGSYAVKIVAKPVLNVDVVLEMPESLITAKVAKSAEKYVAKRLEFIELVAKKLQPTNEVVLSNISDVIVGHSSATGKAVVVTLTAPSTTAVTPLTTWQVRLFPIPPKSLTAASVEEKETNLCEEANSDAMMLTHNIEIYTQSQRCAGFRDATVLLKVWARARVGLEGFGGFLSTLFLARLASCGKASKHINSYQYLRVALASLSHLNDEKEEQEVAMEQELWKNGNWELLRHSAKVSLAQLDADTTPNGGFEALFTSKMSSKPALIYDMLLHTTLSAADQKESATALLRKGLGTRAQVVCRLPSLETTSKSLVVGIVLESAGGEALRMVDKGPSADDEEGVAQFKALWGDKAQVRRFKDGSILMAVVWDGVEKGRRTVIVHQICSHLLSLHHSVDPAAVYVSGSQLDSLLPSDESTESIDSSFELLAKRLRELDLPIKIKSISPTSAALRFTDVCPPQPCSSAAAINGTKQFISPLRGVISFEPSSAWPSDIEAIHKVKTALYVKIAEVLTAIHMIDAWAYEDRLEVMFKGFAFSFVIYHPMELTLLRRTNPALGAAQSVELIHRPLHTAAMRTLAERFPAYSKTVRLCKRWTNAQFFSRHISEEAVELIVAHLFTNSSPALPPANHVVGLLRFLDFFATGINLAELPVHLNVDINNDLSAEDNSLISNHFSRLVKSFNAPPKNNKKKKKSTLQLPPTLFITTTHCKRWSPFSSSSPSAVVLKRMINFARVSATVLEKLILAPRQPYAGEWRVLFNHPMGAQGGYDVQLLLAPESLTRLSQAIPWQLSSSAADIVRTLKSASSKKRTTTTTTVDSSAMTTAKGEPPVIGFDPATLFYEELIRFFGDKALFFTNSLGGESILVVWKPASLTEKPWRITECHSMAPVSGKKNIMKLNLPEALRDMALLGSGLVSKVISNI